MRRLGAALLALLIALGAPSCGFFPGLKEMERGNPRERAAELIPHFEERYFLSALDDHRLGAVCDIYEAAMDFASSCALDGVSSGELTQVLNLMFAECPELYQMDNAGSVTGLTDRATGKFVSLDLNYLMERGEYAESRGECENVIAGFVRDTAGLAPEQRERFVFDAIASTCRYDLESPYAGTAWGALVERGAKCDGVSAAFKWSMEELGIPCVTLTADIAGGVVGHAWNAVELDGEWYRVDLTQSTRIDEFVEAGLDGVIYYAFNISDSFVTERYEVLDCFASVRDVPVCAGMERSFYVTHDLFIRDAGERNRIVERELSSFAGDGGGSFTVQFSSAEDYRAFPDALGGLVNACYNGRDLRYRTWACQSLPYNVCVVTVEE